MAGFYRTNYFFIRRLHSLLGIIPVGAFFLVHMLLNSRALQSRAAYQCVPDTLDQVPFIVLVEIGFILLPIAFHGILGAVIVYQGDINLTPPARGWYENWAYLLQRITGVLLFVMLIIHMFQTLFVHWGYKMRGEHDFDIFAMMQGIVYNNPVWWIIYFLFVLIAAYHFGNGVFNFTYKWGFTSSKLSMRWAIAAGLLVGLLGLFLGASSLCGFQFAEHAAPEAAMAAEHAALLIGQ